MLKSYLLLSPGTTSSTSIMETHTMSFAILTQLLLRSQSGFSKAMNRQRLPLAASFKYALSWEGKVPLRNYLETPMLWCNWVKREVWHAVYFYPQPWYKTPFSVGWYTGTKTHTCATFFFKEDPDMTRMKPAHVHSHSEDTIRHN